MAEDVMLGGRDNWSSAAVGKEKARLPLRLQPTPVLGFIHLLRNY